MTGHLFCIPGGGLNEKPGGRFTQTSLAMDSKWQLAVDLAWRRATLSLLVFKDRLMTRGIDSKYPALVLSAFALSRAIQR